MIKLDPKGLKDTIEQFGPARSLLTLAVRGDILLDQVEDQSIMLPGCQENKGDFFLRARDPKEPAASKKAEEGIIAFMGESAAAIADLLVRQGISVAKITAYEPEKTIESKDIPAMPSRFSKQRYVRGPVKYGRDGRPLPKNTETFWVKPSKDDANRFLLLKQYGIHSRPDIYVMSHADANRLEEAGPYKIQELSPDALTKAIAAPENEALFRQLFSQKDVQALR